MLIDRIQLKFDVIPLDSSTVNTIDVEVMEMKEGCKAKLASS